VKIFAAKRTLWPAIAALIAIGFGLLTIRSGATVLFGSEEARRAAGSYLAPLVWFNFLAGFAYVAAGAGLWLRQRWGVLVALGIALATAFAFGTFGVHVAGGGAYEIRTVWAMLLRMALWVVIAFFAWRAIGCRVPGQAHQG
jgi:hypothetical protein